MVDAPVPGLVSIAGGKFTTYRLMAKDVVDAAVENFPRLVPPSVTGELPLIGADGLPAVRASPSGWRTTTACPWPRSSTWSPGTAPPRSRSSS